MKQTNLPTLAILGAGPSALFLYKRLLESKTKLAVCIYEKGAYIGAGMPYSPLGANDEHITNVSDNEIPDLVTSIADWLYTVPEDILKRFKINPAAFTKYQTLPRLLFGRYLSDQFAVLKKRGDNEGLTTILYYNSTVTDIIDHPAENKVYVEINNREKRAYDRVAICTGHLWPKKYEGIIPNYYDSPYPPAKLQFIANHAVAIRGSSLTAIDAIRTLARSNGAFSEDASGKIKYDVHPGSENFRVIMHSRNGLLPALRFHLQDSTLGKSEILEQEEIAAVRHNNDGFLPLDYVFSRIFKSGVQKNDPDFYDQIKDQSMEQFVDMIMDKREKLDPFKLLAAEYAEAEKSIKRRESIYWKEMLGVLSYAMNYPAKYFSAEDMLRLQRVLMPLISVVIAYVPQNSALEMFAMHQAGRLDLISVGDNSEIEPVKTGGIIYHYTDEKGIEQHELFPVFIDCIGQPHLSFEELPYPGLIKSGAVSPAKLYFRNEEAAKNELKKGNDKVEKDDNNRYFLLVSGITINDSFQAVDVYNQINKRIYVMAVPFIGGYNPDYSGLDFSATASDAVVKSLEGAFK